MKVVLTLLSLLVVAVIVLNLSWCGQDLPDVGGSDDRIHEAGAKDDRAVVRSDAVQQCVKELQIPRRVSVVRESEFVGGAPGSTSVESHGVLPDGMKGDVDASLRRGLLSVERQRREAVTAGNDLRKEARLARTLETRKAQLEMLAKDEYVLLDPGAVHRIWPVAPEGYRVITVDTLVLPSGKPAELVMAIEIDRFEGLKSASDYWRIAKHADGLSAAYEFNGLGDDVRFASMKAHRARGGQDAAGAVRRGVFLIRKAYLSGLSLDPNRALIVE